MIEKKWLILFFFSSRRRHTRYWRDWSSYVCSSDLDLERGRDVAPIEQRRDVPDGGESRVRPLPVIEEHGCGGAVRAEGGVRFRASLGLHRVGVLSAAGDRHEHHDGDRAGAPHEQTSLRRTECRHTKTPCRRDCPEDWCGSRCCGTGAEWPAASSDGACWAGTHRRAR